MKANELMQGYIVLYEYDGQKFPARVIEIYRNSVLVESIDGEYEPIEIEEDKIFPVSLTPEILEKNGFTQCEPQGYDLYVKDKEGRGLYRIFWQSEPYNYLEICGYTYAFGDFQKSNIKYVHQLQRALRLCGIEKEIAL